MISKYPQIFIKTPFIGKSQLKKGNKLCDNFSICQNSSTQLNKIKKLFLCVLCEKEYLRGNYCYFCQAIFIGDISDNKTWIECINPNCNRWVNNTLFLCFYSNVTLYYLRPMLSVSTIKETTKILQENIREVAFSTDARSVLTQHVRREGKRKRGRFT